MADALGVSTGTIANDVKAIFAEWQKERVDDISRWIEKSDRRLERAIRAIWNQVLAGDIKAIRAMIDIINQQGRLRRVHDITVHVKADWREELREAVDADDFDAGQVFEELVQYFATLIESGAE